MTNTLLIVDGNNIAYRCKHVFQLSYKGEDVSVTYGFLSILNSILSKFSPSACIVAWDYGIPRYRRLRMPEYKANRVKDNDDFNWQEFIRQMNELHNEILPMCGVHSVKFNHTEADDIMYHAAFMAHDLYDAVAIISSDDDLLQALNIGDSVFIYNHSKKAVVKPEYITKEYGINPKDIVHWRAIQGDSSDNIAGARGIGPKTATKLFQQYGSLAGIINAMNDPTVQGKEKSALIALGLEGIKRNVFVMALGFDRSGVRNRLDLSLDHYTPANVKDLKQYLLMHAFTSLMDGALYNNFRRLSQPTLANDMKMPVTWPGYYQPVEA